MEKLDTQDLIKALKKSKHTVCIIGPYAEKEQPKFTEEEWHCLTHKSLVKHTDDFYRLFNRYFENADADKDSCTYQCLKELKDMNLIHQFYVQHITSLYHELSPIYLKGDEMLECRVCKTVYSLETAQSINYRCEQNHFIRPRAILPNDKYNLDILHQYDEDLSVADIVFFIGFDFNEEPLLDTIYSISNMKYRIDQETKERFRTITVVVEEIGAQEDAQALYDEYHFDFIVNEHPDTAMKRLNEIIKRTI